MQRHRLLLLELIALLLMMLIPIEKAEPRKKETSITAVIVAIEVPVSLFICLLAIDNNEQRVFVG